MVSGIVIGTYRRVNRGYPGKGKPREVGLMVDRNTGWGSVGLGLVGTVLRVLGMGTGKLAEKNR